MFVGQGPRGIDFAPYWDTKTQNTARKKPFHRTAVPFVLNEQSRLLSFFYFFSLFSTFDATLVLCLRTINNQCWQYCRSQPPFSRVRFRQLEVRTPRRARGLAFEIDRRRCISCREKLRCLPFTQPPFGTT